LPAVVSPYDLEEGGDVSAAIDPDGDGLLGIPYVVTGIVNGPLGPSVAPSMPAQA
jgi:hypothetical protein